MGRWGGAWTRSDGTTGYNYVCLRKGCRAAIKQKDLDIYAQVVMIRYLERPDVYAAVKGPGSDSVKAQAARADAGRLRAEIEDVRRLAEAGEMSPVMAARTEKGLLKRLGDAEQIAREAVMPGVIADIAGPDAAARWAQLDISVKRKIMRAGAEITVRRIGKGRWRGVTVGDRTGWKWLFGPDAAQDG